MEREANIYRVSAYESTPKSKEDKFKTTIAFLKTAISEGAHLKRQLNKNNNPSEDEWIRQKNIIGVYFGSPAALEDIGIMYGVTREMVRLSKDRGMRSLWRNCSLETQEIFPFQELALDKPRSQRFKERASRSNGGVSIFIRDQIASGKSVKQILEEGKYSMLQFRRARRRLKGWGTEVPYVHTPKFQNIELEKRLETDKEKQELLNQAKKCFYQDHVKGENPLLNTLTNIVLEVGLSLGFKNQNVSISIESLKNAEFPMAEINEKRTSRTGEEKIVKYHFLLAKDKERAKQILLSDPNLQRFKRS